MHPGLRAILHNYYVTQANIYKLIKHKRRITEAKKIKKGGRGESLTYNHTYGVGKVYAKIS